MTPFDGVCRILSSIQYIIVFTTQLNVALFKINTLTILEYKQAVENHKSFFPTNS